MINTFDYSDINIYALDLIGSFVNARYFGDIHEAVMQVRGRFRLCTIEEDMR
jgi:hypothetical protein